MTEDENTHIKVIPRMEILGCDECPYMSWESESCAPDFFQCNHDDAKLGHNSEIMDQWYYTVLQRKEGIRHIPFPDGCPLKDKRKRRTK